MSTEKKISIFLASSIEELKTERDQIGNFIRELQDIYKRNNIDLLLVRCDDFRHQTLSKTDSQEELNNEIRECSIALFIFATKVGEFTKGEFKAAWDNLMKNNQPQILVYFKNVENLNNNYQEEMMRELEKECVENVKEHYFRRYDNIDTIKLSIVLQIEDINAHNIPLDIEKGKIILYGYQISDLCNIPAFDKNKSLDAMNNRLAYVSKKCSELKSLCKDEPDNPNYRIDYENAAMEKGKLQEEISKIEKDIFEMMRSMVHNRSNGNISERQAKAYDLFEKGDYDGALKILDYNTITTELDQRMEVADAARTLLNESVMEHIQRAKILTSMDVLETNLDEILKLYDKAFETSILFNLDLSFVFDYFEFLNRKLLWNKLISVTDKYNENARQNQLNETDILKIKFYNGTALHKKKEYMAEYTLFKNAVDSMKGDLENRSQENLLWLGRIYQMLSLSCAFLNSRDEALQYANTGLRIFDGLTKENYDKYASYMAKMLNDAGFVNRRFGNTDTAESCYLKSIEIKKNIKDTFCEQDYKLSIATTYTNLAFIYLQNGQYDKAGNYYTESYNIRKELYKNNRLSYGASYALSCYRLANYYCVKKIYNDAEPLYKESLSIYERLIDKNLDIYGHRYANACIDYGNMLLLLGDREAAVGYYKKCEAAMIKRGEKRAAMEEEAYRKCLEKLQEASE